MNRMHFVAPILVPITAFVAAFTVYVLSGVALAPASRWLDNHESIQNAAGLLDFALMGLSSALAVGYLTRILGRRVPSAARWPEQHIRSCFLLYLVLLVSGVARARCSDCEGLILGAITVYGLTALGGIIGSVWTLLRR